MDKMYNQLIYDHQLILNEYAMNLKVTDKLESVTKQLIRLSIHYSIQTRYSMGCQGYKTASEMLFIFKK